MVHVPEVDPRFKEPKPDRHPRGCVCKPCQGRRNRRKGMSKQRLARKALGVPDGRFHGQNGNEENWRWAAARLEVKAGKQVQPIETRFRAAQEQSDNNCSFGDPRPFAMVAMPDGTTDGILLIRLSQVDAFVAGYIEAMSA